MRRHLNNTYGYLQVRQNASGDKLTALLRYASIASAHLAPLEMVAAIHYQSLAEDVSIVDNSPSAAIHDVVFKAIPGWHLIQASSFDRRSDSHIRELKT